MFISAASSRRALHHGHYHSRLPLLDVEGLELSASIPVRRLLFAVLHFLHTLPHVSIRSKVRGMASARGLIHVSGHLAGQPVHHLPRGLPKAQEHESNQANPPDHSQDQQGRAHQGTVSGGTGPVPDRCQH